MKFVCDKATLCEAVNTASAAVSSKSTLIALECVLLRLKNNLLEVVGYNLELGITKEIEVQSFQEGAVILSAKLFGEIINKMPNTELTFTIDDKLLTIIKGGGAQFTILGMSAEEYPELPVVSEEEQFTIDHELLRSMVGETIFAVSQDTSNPILTGTLFEAKAGTLHLVSVDGRRLALRKEIIDYTGFFKFVVPGKTLTELLRLVTKFSSDGEEEKIKVNIGSKHIIFECSGYRVISRLLDGEFIDYNGAIPKDPKTVVTVSVREFSDSISRASIIINDKIKNPIKTIFENGTVTLSCETSLGKVNDSFDAKIDGDRVKIGYNNKFMLDALKASGADTVLLHITSPLAPVKIMPLEGEHFTYLVMPMRLKDDE